MIKIPLPSPFPPSLSTALVTNANSHPSAIIPLILEEIIASLNQAKDDNLSKDGMDMTICSIDFEGKKLEFSGANNPLIIVRRGELIEYKGNKQPVGMLMGELQPFTNHVIELEKGDALYLFSDGFQDQFGGNEDKKYSRKRLWKLLLEVQTSNIQDQEEIIDTVLDKWKGKNEQTDDICLLGIEI